jgi:glycosyltransferase involved in cell wall biosynthesis
VTTPMIDPLRILELRTVFGTGGGPDKTILAGAACSDPARYRITVCYVRDATDPTFQIDARAASLNIDYTEVREHGSCDPRIWRQLLHVVRDRRIDIVHAHDYKTDLLAWLLATREGIQAMSTAHGWSGHSFREKRIYYPGDRWLLARFAHVVAVSSDIAAALVRAGARADRVSVVPNGIDHARFRRRAGLRERARRRFGIGDGAVAIGAIGRLEREKNFGLLVRAFARMAAVHPHAELIIAGEGSLRQDLQREIDSLGSTGSRCRLIGQVDDVIELHHALDLFVQSSDNEGTPNAVLEAMALETPIVATAAGGTAELARHELEALIVPTKDEQALAAAMVASLSQPDPRRRRVEAARMRVETELSFEQRVRRIEAIYDQLAGRQWAPAVEPLGASAHA